METVKNPVLRGLIYVALSLFALYSVVPFFWTALQSIKTVRDANSRTPLLIFEPTFENYEDLWLDGEAPANAGLILLGLFGAAAVLVVLALNADRLPGPSALYYWLLFLGIAFMLWLFPRLFNTAEFYDYFINSIIVTVGTVAISITLGCLAGYGLARYSGIISVVILIAALGFRALPRMAFILPYFQIGRLLNLQDSYALVIVTLVAVNQPFTIWMLRSFFMDIPKEIEESAMVDGANRLVAFWRVIIPIMWPGIISTSLFTVLLAYNEFLLVRILTQSNWTLPVAIAQFTGGEDPGHITLASAAAVSATIPIILLILFFQKQLVKGLSAGAVKG